MREVKEIRLGKFSKDFDKWPDESRKVDNLRCFVIFYGSEFKLKVFSVAGKTLLVHDGIFNFSATWVKILILSLSTVGKGMRTMAERIGAFDFGYGEFSVSFAGGKMAEEGVLQHGTDTRSVWRGYVLFIFLKRPKREF